MSTEPVRWHEDQWEYRCSLCTEWWPLDMEFWRPISGMKRCRACWREYQRDYQRRRQANPEVARERRAAQRMKHHANAEVRRAATRRWKAANHEHVLAYQRAYYARTRGKAA